MHGAEELVLRMRTKFGANTAKMTTANTVTEIVIVAFFDMCMKDTQQIISPAPAAAFASAYHPRPAIHPAICCPTAAP